MSQATDTYRIKQQIISGLSYDLNTLFVSNKYLTKVTRSILIDCNKRLLRFETDSAYDKLKENFKEFQLPMIREILSNCYLVTALDTWKTGLSAEGSIIDLLVNHYEKYEESREPIIRELSKYSNSNFSSIIYFIEIFLFKLSRKKDLIKNVLSFKRLHHKLLQKIFVCLIYGISQKYNSRGHKDSFFKFYFIDISLLRENYKDFYYISNTISNEYKEIEISRILKRIFNFIKENINNTRNARRWLAILSRGGYRASNIVYDELPSLMPKYYKLFVTNYSVPFESWVRNQRELSSKYISFIERMLISEIKIDTKLKLVQILKNEPFIFINKQNKRIRLSEKKMKTILKDFLNKHKNIFEFELKAEIKKFIVADQPVKTSVVQQRLNPNVFDYIAQDIKEGNFDKPFKILNDSSGVLDFIAFIKSKEDEELQVQFNHFLNQKWIK